jgi:preprotein translocase subunit SecA
MRENRTSGSVWGTLGNRCSYHDYAFKYEVHDMEIDEDKIDETVLALLALTLHDERRAWKGMDFDVMNRLHEKGYIDDPINKTKSVWLTDEGLAKSEELFKKLFSK